MNDFVSEKVNLLSRKHFVRVTPSHLPIKHISIDALFFCDKGKGILLSRIRIPILFHPSTFCPQKYFFWSIHKQSLQLTSGILWVMFEFECRFLNWINASPRKQESRKRFFIALHPYLLKEMRKCYGKEIIWVRPQTNTPLWKIGPTKFEDLG